MGHDIEGELSFGFSKDTPAEVLAAFAALAAPDLPAEAPDLPPPVIEAWDDFEPEWRDAGYPEEDGDPYTDQMWRHDWAPWISMTPEGRLTWSEAGGWRLDDCKFGWKTHPETVTDALSWLAPFVATEPGQRTLVCEVQGEYWRGPHRYYVEDGQWVVEEPEENI